MRPIREHFNTHNVIRYVIIGALALALLLLVIRSAAT